MQFLFKADGAEKHKFTSDFTSQNWFPVNSSLTCASAKTSAFGEDLEFVHSDYKCDQSQC